MNTLRLMAPHWHKLADYARGALVPENTRVILRNAWSLAQGRPWLNYGALDVSTHKLHQGIHHALGWLKRSVDQVGAGGLGCYDMRGWTPGYPEVTGYTIPTLYHASQALHDPGVRTYAERMARWLLTQQLEGGAVAGHYEGSGQPPVVFNTGQVIRGLFYAYRETNEAEFLDAATRAADWIIAHQDQDGSWSRRNYRNMKRVYDTYVAAPLLQLGLELERQDYLEAGRKNCEFALSQQRKNGWFQNCDNTRYYNKAPSTHTLCYTIDGLIECGKHLDEPRYIKAATQSVESLLHQAEIQPMFYGRFDAKFSPRADYVCLTGAAQFGGILVERFEAVGDPRYLNAALKLADFLLYVQQLNGIGDDRHGGLAGAYPIWGMYAPLKYPSWATKYLLDFLLALRPHAVTLLD